MNASFTGKCDLSSLAETQAWAAAFARHLEGDDVVALTGNLGAGKTFLVQKIVAALGSDAEATSPTFALVNEYHANGKIIYHWDFYRMQEAVEALNIGWMEMLTESGAIHLVEWADRFPELIPKSAWRISLEALTENERGLQWTGPRPLTAV